MSTAYTSDKPPRSLYPELPTPEDDPKTKEHRFTVGEHVVLLTIIALSLLTGMLTMTFFEKVYNAPQDSNSAYIRQAGSIAGHTAGAILTATLSEIRGRKPSFILLATLCIISSICLAIPSNIAVLIGFAIQSISRGGAETMIFLAIAEYCNPKHRFGYLIASVTVWYSIGEGAHNLKNYIFGFGPDLVHVLWFTIVLGVVCLVSACVWPESPYWLAAHGRREDAAWTLRRLRGERAESELNQLKQEPLKQEPSEGLAHGLKLYWRQFLVALIIISVTTVTVLQSFTRMQYFVFRFPDSREVIIQIGAALAVSAIIAAISYFVKRKVLYVVCCALPIALSYVVGIYAVARGGSLGNLGVRITVLIMSILRICGPQFLSLILCSEIIPYKYNTHMSCVCAIYKNLVLSVQMYIMWIRVVYDYAYVLDLICSTLSVVGVALFYWLAPETKDMTLFEIQKSGTPQASTKYKSTSLDCCCQIFLDSSPPPSMENEREANTLHEHATPSEVPPSEHHYLS